ncbi:MAG: hypothetical protein MR775_04870 [Erysipelotrichaceae bacterium]|nr:hypothetical protein [Erysipelotrichaceae bacterium]
MNNNNKLALNAIRAYKAKALKDSKDAKPEGDKVKAYNNALTYAKKENKPFIYGYTNRNGKFFAIDTPMKVSVSPADAEKEFRKRYKNCSVVYIAYPDKEFIKDEKIDVEKELLANHFEKRKCKPGINGNDICYYDYKGTGYFPEVVARLQNKLGKFDYVGETNRIVGIKHKHKSLKEDAVELSLGEKLAKAVAKAFKGQCGPFGGENPTKYGNKVSLYSQAGVTWYIFNDDGSVDVEPDDETISLAEEDGEEITTHYNSADELFNGEDGWFYDAPSSLEKQFREILKTRSNVKDANLYIYQFPASMTKEDMKEAKKYGLEILGKVGENGFQPGDWIIQGTLKQLEKFCDESLGYVMHPDYLYKSKEFDIEDVLVKDEALGEVQVDEFAEEEPNVSKKIEHQGKWTKNEINGQEMTVEQFLEEYDAGNLPIVDAIYPESGGFKISIEEVRKLPKDTMGRFLIYDDEVEVDDEFGPYISHLLWFQIEGI